LGEVHVRKFVRGKPEANARVGVGRVHLPLKNIITVEDSSIKMGISTCNPVVWFNITLGNACHDFKTLDSLVDNDYVHVNHLLHQPHHVDNKVTVRLRSHSPRERVTVSSSPVIEFVVHRSCCGLLQSANIKQKTCTKWVW